METLACGHVAHPGRRRVCPHMLDPAANEDVAYVRLLSGNGLDGDLCCTRCDRDGDPELAVVCEGCVALYDDGESGYFEGWRGEPGVSERPEPVDTTVTVTPLPGPVLDLAPLPSPHGEPSWLVLGEGGRWLLRFQAAGGAYRRVCRVRLPAEETTPRTRLRLHASPDGRFAAVVRDFGRFGRVYDLASGKATIEIDGGDYHCEQVPLSLVFFRYGGSTLVAHRTAWNRLDISDPATGRLLTARDEADGERRLAGLFRGELRVSPDGRWIADDSWAWAPAGIPYVWDLRRWAGAGVWESDDGPSRQRLCQRFYFWNEPMCWIGDSLLAVAGLGDDDEAMLPGVRIFDAASGVELHDFAGPGGALFSAGRRLYAAGADGLTIWDPFTGERTGSVPGFVPTHHHRDAGLLAAVRDGALLTWRH
ncbi:hypothetical protein [Actinoplanes xinjiangensis]|nr:hypothetical protein [Actinoplanes xinjiangensis]GIF42441.1 hypothetical protein Axi01nite_67520 [Actinoplanes xinjiangensis]